ncbi:MAG: DUF5683 domain-containing protein [Flavobacteriales bacterium]|tara:strand:- start:2775 stop:3299 length:525 start_codon:yes stop_codon:yes gene_type:complete
MFSKHLIAILCLYCFVYTATAQQVSVTKSPAKASMYSAILPGSGQIYNEKYWKAPLVYAAMGTALYLANWNQKEYLHYRNAYEYRTDGDATTIDDYDGIYTESNLITIKNYHQKNRDLAYIITAGIYLLNIVDASVDAHLFNFNVNDDLSFKLEPKILRLQNQNQYGLALTLHL